LEEVDFAALKEELFKELGRAVTDFDVLAYALYPKVFLDYNKTIELFGDVSNLDTATFLYGMRLGEEIEVEIEKGKTLIVKLVSIGQPLADGTRVVYFELNGQSREVIIKDENIKSSVVSKVKADPKNKEQIGATMPGTVIRVVVEKGDQVKQGDHLIITEAMKMETTVQAPFSGTIKDIYVKDGEAISTGDLLIEITK
jgi:pyruvate carboxylase